MSLHQELLSQLKQLPSERGNQHDHTYLGNEDKVLGLTAPQMKSLVKEFHLAHKNLGDEEFFSLIDTLYTKAQYAEEKHVAGYLLSKFTKQRASIRPAHIDGWLGYLKGWAQVDSLCQNVFTYQDMLNNWNEWEELLEELVLNENINKRRASLVLLVGPLRYSDNSIFLETAFENINRLKSEKDILLTKAISWLLRAGTKLHHAEIKAFVAKHESTLPPIAVRETKRKLETGKK